MTARTASAAEGFTLLEIIIAIAILTGLAALAAVSFRPFSRNVDLQTATQQLLTALHQTRDRTLASEGSTTYGLHFENDRYVIFAGDAYNPSAADNEVQTLPAQLEIYDISIGGGSEVVFKRLTGATDTPGTVSLRVKAAPEQTNTITIIDTGQASRAVTGTLADTRLTDTRHVHYNLTGSIQNSSTLQLNFGSAVETVDMADYFNAGKTLFDWQGTIAVGGEDQTLQIHTHELTPATTVLSIHRDRRYNTAGVTVSIDGQTVATYGADGTATVGPLGGELEVQ